jgi:hypothetical protein
LRKYTVISIVMGCFMSAALAASADEARRSRTADSCFEEEYNQEDGVV